MRKLYLAFCIGPSILKMSNFWEKKLFLLDLKSYARIFNHKKYFLHFWYFKIVVPSNLELGNLFVRPFIIKIFCTELLKTHPLGALFTDFCSTYSHFWLVKITDVDSFRFLFREKNNFWPMTAESELVNSVSTGKNKRYSKL